MIVDDNVLNFKNQLMYNRVKKKKKRKVEPFSHKNP